MVRIRVLVFAARAAGAGSSLAQAPEGSVDPDGNVSGAEAFAAPHIELTSSMGTSAGGVGFTPRAAARRKGLSRAWLPLGIIVATLAACEHGPVAPGSAPPERAGASDTAVAPGPRFSYALSSGLLISPVGLDFGDVQVGSTSPQQIITVTNIASAPVVMSGLGGGSSNADFQLSQNCAGRTLAPDQSCQMFAAFAPTADGPDSAQSIGTWNSQGFTIGYRGQGVPPRFLVSPAAIDFGEVVVGGPPVTLHARVTNVGLAPVAMSGLSGGPANPAVSGAQNCQGRTIVPGSSCDMFYTIALTTVGDVSTEAAGTWNGQPFTVALHGTGVEPTFRISPTSLEFGEVPNNFPSPSQVVTVTNISSASVTMTGIGGGPADGHFSATQHCQSRTLPPGASCTILYSFTPTATGEVTSQANGTWNGRPFTILLHGTGFPAPTPRTNHLLISPTALDFGDVTVGTSVTDTVTITNVASVPLTLSGIGGGAPDAHLVVSQNCQARIIQPGASCQAFYTFTPTEAGVVSATASGSWNGQSFAIQLLGNGVTPRFRIDAAGLEFGDVQVGTTSPTQVVTVTSLNPTPVVLSGIGGNASSAEFDVTQNCQSRTLAPGGSCEMVATFAPTGTGPATDASVGSWNGWPFHIDLHGGGVAPRFLVTPYALDFGLVPVGVTSPKQRVTVINAGLGSVTVAGVAGGPNRSEFHASQDCQARTLIRGQACQMLIDFTPDGAGQISAAAAGTWNDQPFAIALQGTGFGGVTTLAMDLAPSSISLAHTPSTSAILLSTPTFDARTVTLANVRMLVNGTVDVPPLSRRGAIVTSTRDWNGDGLVDRMFSFQTSALAAAGLTAGAGPGVLVLRDNVSVSKWEAHDAAPPVVVP